MAASLIVESESGTYTGKPRRHNGYWAGDFSAVPMPSQRALAELAKLRPPTYPDLRR